MDANNDPPGTWAQRNTDQSMSYVDGGVPLEDVVLLANMVCMHIYIYIYIYVYMSI